MNNVVYVLGAILLTTGCMRSEFKKTFTTFLCEIVGFVLMMIAFIVK